ncbi:MAG: hypothetical protein JSU70_18490 [Phycisphaerales bacterium]|nr:MAG: hypothetical protein JSU70_18490 [Phycisphaerales bacterium]
MESTDESLGICRPMLSVPFEQNIAEPEHNPNVRGDLGKELPDILNRARENLQQLKSQGHFTVAAKCRQTAE